MTHHHNDKNDNEARRKVVQYLLADCGLTEIEARDVEVGVFNWCLKAAEDRSVAKSWRHGLFPKLYASKARAVLCNLNPESPVGNTRLLTRMREREFLPHDLAGMMPQHMFPERWKNVVDLKVQKDEYIHNEKPAAKTSQFKCGRCKKRECDYQELQLRSCDEPVSLFITCLNCGNRWRIG